VVVLVLMLKSFTAEAFVIPTGSMAETLWGYQKLVTCPECGFEFPVNCSSEVEGKTLVKVTHCVCPNCRLDISFEEQKFNPSCNTGDRVLVAKHLNDLHVLDLQRLDVVVFKFPEEPQRDFVPMNYIKRLVGLPGETIGILNGDIYIAKNIPYEQCEFVKWSSIDRKVTVKLADAQGNFGEPVTLDLADDAHLRVTRDQVEMGPENLDKGDLGVIAMDPESKEKIVIGLQLYKDLPLRRQTHRNFPLAKKALLDGNDPSFQILRKPPAKVLALRRIVYDNNHQAKDLLEKKVPQRWEPEKDEKDRLGKDTQDYLTKRRRASKDAWISDGKFGFQHKTSPGEEIDWLRYRHLADRRSASLVEPKEIKDFMGYNTGNGYGEDGVNWVGDLILEFKAVVKEAQGELIVELSKGDDRFRAQWDLSTGTCRLLRLTFDSAQELTNEQELAKKETSLKKPGTYRLRFANVDERLIVWVDGSLPFGDGVPYDPQPDRMKNGNFKPNDLEPASIGAKAGAVNVSDLSLWRDTYYTNNSGKSEVNTMYVQPGHYLCMGDNSPQSSDSRSWDRQDRNDGKGGLVPERLMLGRALLVYWPFWPYDNRVGPIK
jgi:signal peptidase I